MTGNDSKPLGNQDFAIAQHRKWIRELRQTTDAKFLETWEEEFGELTQEQLQTLVQVDMERARLPLALACLERIRRLWKVQFGDESFKMRIGGDADLYRALRSILIAQVTADPAWLQLHAQATHAVPENLPTRDELLDFFDEEVMSTYERNFHELEARIAAQAIASRSTLNIRQFDPLFKIHDEHLEYLGEVFRRNQDEEANRFALGPNPIQPKREYRPGASEKANQPYRGRKRKDVPYEVAAELWTKLYKAYEDEPSQQELVRALKTHEPKSYSISVRTFQRNIDRWNTSGFTWPPTPPELED